jgi:hypothetical protein
VHADGRCRLRFRNIPGDIVRYTHQNYCRYADAGKRARRIPESVARAVLTRQVTHHGQPGVQRSTYDRQVMPFGAFDLDRCRASQLCGSSQGHSRALRRLGRYTRRDVQEQCRAPQGAPDSGAMMYHIPEGDVRLWDCKDGGPERVTHQNGISAGVICEPRK